MTNGKLEQILYSALAQPVGLEISTNSPADLKRRLYQTRAAAKKAGIEVFNDLSFRTSPTNAEGSLWIIHKKPATITAKETSNAPA